MKNVNHQLFCRSVIRYLIDQELICISTHSVFVVPLNELHQLLHLPRKAMRDAKTTLTRQELGQGDARELRFDFCERKVFVQLGNEKYPCCLGYLGDEILPSYIGIIS